MATLRKMAQENKNIKIDNERKENFLAFNYLSQTTGKLKHYLSYNRWLIVMFLHDIRWII
jgi:hypothetical protein